MHLKVAEAIPRWTNVKVDVAGKVETKLDWGGHPRFELNDWRWEIPAVDPI